MAMDKDKLKSEMKQRIYNGLKREFQPAVSLGQGYPPIADGFWMKLADAISDAAFDIVNDIQQDAEVQPGIPSSPTQTTGPGKIK